MEECSSSYFCLSISISMNFFSLVQSIQQTHIVLQQQVNKAINHGLTIRNWLIGFYIAEFEQKGEDRATYGDRLLQKLAEALNERSLSFRNLNLFRQFYFTYPQIGQSVIGQLSSNFQLNSVEFKSIENQILKIVQLAIAQSDNQQMVPPEKLISKLSYTHLVQLFPIGDPLKRVFYEIECINDA
jgi:hypothetical protein